LEAIRLHDAPLVPVSLADRSTAPRPQAQEEEQFWKPTPDEVLEARDAGRAFEAVRLLNLLDEDSEVGEEAASRMRENVRAVSEMGSTLATVYAEAGGPGSSPAAASPTSQWGRRSTDSVECYYQYGKATGRVEIIADITVQLNVIQTWTLVREFDLASGWLANIDEVQPLHSFETHCELYRVLMPPVLPMPMFPSMVAFQERSYLDCIDDDGSMYVIVQSPLEEETNWRGVSLPAETKGEKRVRQRLRNRLRPLTKDTSAFTAHIILDTPLYYIPDWIVGKVASSVARKVEAKLATAAARFVEGGWKDRLESGPHAEYFANVQKRFENRSPGAAKLNAESTKTDGVMLSL